MNALSDLQLRVAARVAKVRANKLKQAQKEAEIKKVVEEKEKVAVVKQRPEPPIELVIVKITLKMKLESWLRRSYIGGKIWSLIYRK